VISNLDNKALRWYGHTERMNEERLPKNVLYWSTPGRSRRRKEK
jgi:hypothetical protein